MDESSESKRPRSAGPTGGQATDLAVVYSRVFALLLEPSTSDNFFQQVTRIASSLSLQASGAMLLRRGHGIVTISTDDLSHRLDELEHGRGYGPGLQVLRTAHTVVSPDLGTDSRWGAYAAYALDRGVRSLVSLPLIVDRVPFAAIVLYSQQTGHFSDHDVVQLEALMGQASTATVLYFRMDDAARLHSQMSEAFEYGALIDQACGVLMGRDRVQAGEAIATLRATSQTTNRKVRDVAADLILTVTGHPPGPPRPFTRRDPAAAQADDPKNLHLLTAEAETF